MNVDERINAAREKIRKNRIRMARMQQRIQQKYIQLCPQPNSEEVKEKYRLWAESVKVA